MFENPPNTNRTRTLFGSVRCGAELEQTEQDLKNVRFGLFARLAISARNTRRRQRRVMLAITRDDSNDGR